MERSINQMVKHLTTVGNSLGLIIDRSILELLKIDRDTPLELITDGDELTIRPLRDQSRAKRLQSATKKIFEEQAETLKKLAE